LLSWADDVRDIGIRANADTPADAQTARNFAARASGWSAQSICSFRANALI
jgi:pyruvate,orthophosphate dikinase